MCDDEAIVEMKFPKDFNIGSPNNVTEIVVAMKLTKKRLLSVLTTIVVLWYVWHGGGLCTSVNCKTPGKRNARGINIASDELLEQEADLQHSTNIPSKKSIKRGKMQLSAKEY
ncbi:hypothetical protein PIB30_041835 [Stylosanthes scabra]|uniref:Uncharacterized protein n=1 Tax=Stylosanthes scabra TaxID=79078 RepID=A0ABU6RFL7_9FABA|nr:hypothetical protein [Stylosanthes scabra]